MKPAGVHTGPFNSTQSQKDLGVAVELSGVIPAASSAPTQSIRSGINQPPSPSIVSSSDESKLGHPAAPVIPTRRWRTHCISKSSRLGNGRFLGSLVVKVNVSPD